MVDERRRALIGRVDMDIIRVEGVAKRYGQHQVHKDLTLAIKRGE